MNHTFFLEQQNMPLGALYVVGTPIGNLGDITYRAVHVLNMVDGIACEDTRHTAHLLNAIGIHKPLIAIHEHNEVEASKSLLNHLKNGERWAYVCDAGTPSISDPGARLSNEVRLAGLQIIPIPGVSAVTSLISVAGQLTNHPSQGFQFLGFLPLKGKDRTTCFSQLNNSSLATVFYESPQRILNTLNDLFKLIVDQQRILVIGREMTKKFETISSLQIQEIPHFISSNLEERGEFCLILGSVNQQSGNRSGAEIDVLVNVELLASAMTEHLGSKQIAEIFAKSQLLSKNTAYELALKLKKPA
jgi:16S rRNA (cytidine1402-2'-O)-methyltransferase